MPSHLSKEQEKAIYDRLVADYLRNGKDRLDYTILQHAIRDETGLPYEIVRDMLQSDLNVTGKQTTLQSIAGPSPGGGPSGRPSGLPDAVTGDYTQEIAPTPEDALLLDQKINFETPGREQIPEDLFGKWGTQRGAIANFVRDNFGDNVSGAFRNFLTNADQQRGLESRFDLASTADPMGADRGFSKFMQGLAPEMFRTSGPNRGQLDLLSRYLGTPDSGAYNIPIPQRDAIEGFRTDQQKQFDLLMNPLIANLSPYSTGGFQRSAQAGFDKWMGRNLENPNAQYLPYIAGRNFVP